MARKSNRSDGVTVIEVLLVIFVIGMMLGLLLPAVQKARAADNGKKCQNNLKQIALAVLNYSSTYQDKLPGIMYYTPSQKGGNGSPFFFSILPFLEQNDLYKQAGAGMKAAPWNEQTKEGKVVSTPVKYYLCPDDLGLKDGLCNNNKDYAGTSYAPNGRMFGTVTRLPSIFEGVLASKYLIAKIPDGTSNTIFIEERVAGYDKSKTTDKWCNSWAYPVVTGQAGSEVANTFGSILHPVDTTPVGKQFKNDDEPAEKFVARLPLFNFKPEDADATRPGSYHPGLCHVAIGDGSVRAVSAKITQYTWNAAIHPTDGNPLGTDW